LELTRSLEETRRSVAGVRELHLLRLVELESRLAEETASLQPSHPAVLAAADAIAALQGEDSPLLGRLQSEEAVLSRELQRRSLRPPVAPGKEKEWEVTSVAAARASLERSQSRHERLLERLQAAKIERESALASFSRRFAVVRPATFPREPLRPKPDMILLGALLGGLALALFAAVMGELRPERRAAIAAVTLCLAGASALGLGLSGHPAAAVAPPILAAMACAMFLLPLRHTALAFLFLMLSLEGPGDAGGLWSSPWAPLGHLLSGNMNLTVPIEALRFTGADVILAGLLLVLAFRRMTFSRIDTAGSLPTPRPLRTAALVSLFAILLLIAWGVARGGSLQQTLWQCHVFALVPVFFFVVSEAIRGPGDFPALGKTVLLAAVVKAVQAIWVRYSLGLDKEALPTATSHHDSMLFAVAFSMLVVLFLEQRTRRSGWWAAALLPILALGMVANNRRLAWVEIAMSLFVIFLLSPRTRLKLKLQRIAVACIPVAVLYLAAGWNSGSRVFAPVAKIRSIVDSNSDRSTRERDVENYNLIVNLIRHPFIPIGFGHEYEQVSMGDDISHIFPQWKYIPHNSALGLFAFSGIPGFTAAWGVITVGVFFAARAFARARDPVWRAAALTSIATVVVYLIQCYGDMGFVSFHSVFLLAPSLAVAGKLSTACGAWRTHRVQS
ncbi:MAG: O-antigen ligase family protein, partial [Myxococcales bacterium]